MAVFPPSLFRLLGWRPRWRPAGALALIAVILALGATAPARAADRAERVVAIGGVITEIIYALGEEDRLVGRDSTSSHPPAALNIPDVGYLRALSPEGVLSLAPDLILATEWAGPPETMDVLQGSGVSLALIPEGYDADGIAAKVEAVGAALGVAPRAQALADEIRAQLAAADRAIAARPGPAPKVLFVMSARGGRIMAAGQGTGAEAIIRLAGGQNAMIGFHGYKPVSDEALLAAAPEVILAMDREGDHAVGPETLAQMPALAATPAGQAARVVRMDGLYLLGFGPRTPQAVRDLAAAWGASAP